MGALQEMKKSAARRLDDFVNVLTGLGNSVRDKLQNHRVTRRELMSHEELAALVDDDDLAATICSRPVDDAFRQGWTLTTSAELGAEGKAKAAKDIAKRAKQLGLKHKLIEGGTLGRGLGLAGIFLGVDDGKAADQPLDIEAVRSLRFLTVLDARDLQVSEIDRDSRSETYLQPKLYTLTAPTGAAVETIHASRILRFGGAMTPFRTRQLNQNHDLSVLHRCVNVIRDLDSSFHSASLALVDASIGVLKIKGLYEELGGPMSEAMKTRIEIMDLARFVGRALPIDAEEDFSYIERTLTAWPALLDRLMIRLSAACGIPVTILFGRSPAGMNATGESDVRSYYDRVQSLREDTYQPLVELVIQLIARDVGAPEPASWGIEWPSLWQMTPQEAADHRLKVGRLDIMMTKAGIWTEDEVAMERSGGEHYSDAPPKVDLEARKAKAKELEDKDNNEQPPEQGAKPPDEKEPETPPRRSTPRPRSTVPRSRRSSR